MWRGERTKPGTPARVITHEMNAADQGLSIRNARQSLSVYRLPAGCMQLDAPGMAPIAPKVPLSRQ